MSKERKDLFARAAELELSPAKNMPTDKLKALIEEAEAAAKTAGGGESGRDPETGQSGTTPAVQDTTPAAGNSDDQGGQEDQGKAPAEPEGVVVVQGPERGRWRIGQKFTREKTRIKRADLTDAELAALEDDPELIVSIL
ncbi:hypothetical protein PXK01_16665 [Phaeobacter sp. PT47_59]|uniref:hypothetical protein n=1 Tax=Phaeobacter sp. PT47_59 TaxID=3029979 RepID=UPI00237FDFD8|nr:hypothetical protein [Phaeobacter sp. PT47_59]MDE4175797.1 hypothetical protein [Phaeobacter sp. PT47_59]